MISKQSAIIWFVFLLVLCGISTYQINNHWQIQTDVLALLPQDEQEPMVQTVRRMVSGELGRTALFLVSHAQPEIARLATRQLGQLMDASSLFATVQWDYSQHARAFHEFYFPFRYRFISPTLRSYLDEEDGYRHLIDHLTRELYQPMSSISTRFLEDDPLLFFPELLKDFATNITELHQSAMMNKRYVEKNGALNETSVGQKADRKIRLEEGLIGTAYAGRQYYFITAQLASNPFAEKTQTQLEERWQAWSNQLRHTTPGLELTYTAAARFASSMRNHMQQDMFFISIGATLGIILLIIIIFRSIKQLFIAFIPLVLGLWSALGVSLLIFEELHAFTLVFGSSLIGVCIDYSMHYFAHHRITQQWQPIITMRNIFPALSLGALTTVLSYIGLSLTPLDGIRQVSIFASCGIIISFFTVVFWFPFLLPSAHPRASRVPIIYQKLEKFLSLWKRRRLHLYVSVSILVILSAIGISNLHLSDSPLVFKTFPADLVEQDRFVRDVMGISEAQQYLVVEGETYEDVLQRLEKFQDYIHANSTRYSEILGPMITEFLPSKKRQEENVRSMRKLLQYEKEISRKLSSLGLPERSIETFFQDLKREPKTFLLPNAWLNHNVSIGLRNFWLDSSADGTSILVRLQRITDVQSIKGLISSFEGIRYVDYMGDFTRILERYRKNIMLLVTGAYVVIFTLLFWRYHLKGFFVMLPPLLGTCITIGLLGLLGQTFHLLHCLSLLLILGMGVDYAIFLAESDPSCQLTTFLASTLATVTTMLSFGLLSFSSQEALKAIGLTTFLGICCVWLLSPIALYGRSRS